MEITVVRTGGIAGLTRRSSVDTDQLGDKASEWFVLIDEARPMLAALPKADSPVRDGFVWTVSVGNDSCERVDDSALTGPLRELAHKALKEGTRL